MLAEVVFVTRLLGLVAGQRTMALEADAAVRAIEIRRDDATIAKIAQPPWSVRLDFGRDLAPHQLTAIGFDADGREIGRDAQLINVARPPAELAVRLERAGEEWTVHTKWTHIVARKPRSMVVTLDNRVVRQSATVEPVSLGRVDMRTIHVAGVEVEFDDRTRARKELVFGGVYTEQMPAELTPVAVRKIKKGDERSCFTLGGTPVNASAIEKGTATVFFVLLRSAMRGRQKLPQTMVGDAGYLVRGAEFVMVSAVPMTNLSELNAEIFPWSAVDETIGTKRFLMRMRVDRGEVRGADAVAAAAVHALGTGRRRAVVLVLGAGDERDHSVHEPRVVRRYLERIGVPLHVWSFDRTRELEEAWGEVQYISADALLRKATDELTRELETQRIVWMPMTPLDAIRIESTSDCAFTPLARAN